MSYQEPRNGVKTISKNKLFIAEEVASFNKWKICGLVFVGIKQVNALKILN